LGTVVAIILQSGCLSCHQINSIGRLNNAEKNKKSTDIWHSVIYMFSHLKINLLQLQKAVNDQV